MLAVLPRVRRFALSLTGRPDQADDLVQDAVERALRNLDRWERGSRMDSWMFRIVQNLWIDRLRARRVRGEAAPVDELDADPIDGVRAAEAHIMLNQTQKALGGLPEEQRAVVGLVLVDGMSYREAADILGVPIGTVTSRLARARDALTARVFGVAAKEAMP